MHQPKINFNSTDNPEFYTVLKQRVSAHFKEAGYSKFANKRMVLKTIFMLSIYFTPLVLILAGIISNLYLIILMWSIMGFGLAGIGLSIMHDANHGAYSRHTNINKFMGFTLNYLGGYHVNWKIQHNVLHHSFTNIDGYDEDIEKKGIIRFSPNQNKRKIFRFQLFYAPILYAILTLYWVTFKDFDQLRNYDKRGLLKAQGISFGQALFRIVLFKVIYFGLLVASPIIFTSAPWWITIVGFLIMHAIGGLILALVFQSAHVLDETEFFDTVESHDMENSWAIHQMKTTSNFAIGNKRLTWFIGGLNHQIEHHLFPTICHVHYPAISIIVRDTANEFGIPYMEQPTFSKAIVNHFRFLNQLGLGNI